MRFFDTAFPSCRGRQGLADQRTAVPPIRQDPELPTHPAPFADRAACAPHTKDLPPRAPPSCIGDARNCLFQRIAKDLARNLAMYNIRQAERVAREFRKVACPAVGISAIAPDRFAHVHDGRRFPVATVSANYGRLVGSDDTCMPGQAWLRMRTLPATESTEPPGFPLAIQRDRRVSGKHRLKKKQCTVGLIERRAYHRTTVTSHGSYPGHRRLASQAGPWAAKCSCSTMNPKVKAHRDIDCNLNQAAG